MHPRFTRYHKLNAIWASFFLVVGILNRLNPTQDSAIDGFVEWTFGSVFLLFWLLRDTRRSRAAQGLWLLLLGAAYIAVNDVTMLAGHVLYVVAVFTLLKHDLLRNATRTKVIGIALLFAGAMTGSVLTHPFYLEYLTTTERVVAVNIWSFLNNVAFVLAYFALLYVLFEEEIIRLTTRQNELAEHVRSTHWYTQIGRQTRSIVHSVKGDLAAISTGVHILRAEVQGENESVAQTIESRIDALSRKVEGILYLSALSERKDIERIALRKLVESIATAMTTDSDFNRRISLSIEGEATCEAVGSHLAMVVETLLKNSWEAIRDAGTKDGEVRVRLQEADSKTKIAIEDNGPGFEGGKLPRSGYTTKKGGSGLGLSFVRETVRDYGGKLEIGRGELGGAKVEIEMPVRG